MKKKVFGSSLIPHPSSFIPPQTRPLPQAVLTFKFENRADDRAEFFVFKLWVERQRENSVNDALGDGERGLRVAAEEGLLVEEVRVVDERLDAARREVLAQGLACGVLRDEEVIDVCARLVFRGELELFALREPAPVFVRQLPTPRVPSFEPPELDAQERRLHLVEARVEPRRCARAQGRLVPALPQFFDALD